MCAKRQNDMGNIMTRLFIYILLTLTTILSCNRANDKFVNTKIEIFKLGVPQYIDTADLSKIGALIYVLYEQDNDSAFFKTCMMKELVENGIYPSDSLTAKYFYKTLQDNEKIQFKYFIDYLKPLKDGRLPNTHRDPETIGCNLLGTWIAILTDSLGKRHYFNFPIYNLPKEIEDLCRNIYITAYPDTNRLSINYQYINTDSIVASTLQLKSMDSIELAPRIKSRIKFTPPDIESDN